MNAKHRILEKLEQQQLMNQYFNGSQMFDTMNITQLKALSELDQDYLG